MGKRRQGAGPRRRRPGDGLAATQFHEFAGQILDWRWGLAGAVLTALIQIIAIRVVLGDTETAGVVPVAVLLAATAGSAGAAVGYYRAVLAATRAQLARETQTREERARRLVAEERLRIARELHDVFGHAMATISVQAGVGLHVIEQRPGQAREALAAIKKICDDGLADVKTILGILRADTPSGGASRARPGAGSTGSPTCSTPPRPRAYGSS